MRFPCIFSSSVIEIEYRKVMEDHIRKLSKLLLLLMIFITIYMIIFGFIRDRIGTIVSASFLLVFYLICWRFLERLRRIMSFLLLFMVVVLCTAGYISYSATLEPDCFSPFFVGYSFGAFERIVSQRLPRLCQKLTFICLTLIAKCVLFFDSKPLTILTQVVVIVLGHALDIWREKEQKDIFKSFYNYREELTKFKTLLVSGFPANVLVLAKNLDRILFINECFQNTLEARISATGTQRPHEWLDQLVINKDSLGEVDKSVMEDKQSNVYSGDTLKFMEALRDKTILVNGGQKFALNTEYSGTDNIKKMFETKVFTLLWDGEEAVVIILDDVTEHHVNLALKSVDMNKDKMIAMISHELRTPLNGILGAVQILEKQIADKEALKYLAVCKNSGKLLMHLVNSILDMGQIRNKKLQLNIVRGDFYELMQEIDSLFRFQFNQKGLKFTLDIAPDIPRYISTDLNRLRQIAINLVGNALKFTFEGEVTISVRLSPNDRDSIQISVSDTGIGIKEEDQKKLFKMYGRLDQQDPKTNTEGVGLGLTISDHLAKLLGGNKNQEGIEVESEIGKGTKFSFTVKVNLSENPSVLEEKTIMSSHTEESKLLDTNEDAQVKLPVFPKISKSYKRLEIRNDSNNLLFENSLNSHGKKLSNDFCEIVTRKDIEEKERVLLVDDNLFNLMVARHLIQEMGYTVETAMNGQLAVRAVVNAVACGRPFHLVIMDLQMPVMDGYEATIALRGMMENKDLPEIPIIALSANDTEEVRERCKLVGMYDHLPKPLSSGNLDKVIKKLLREGKIP